MASPSIHITGPGGASHDVRVPAVGLSVGRSPDNDLVLAHDGVSRHHCVFWVGDDLLWVRDRGSRNGTFVDDLRIDAAQPVDDRCSVRLGEQVVLTVRNAPLRPEPGMSSARHLLEDEESGVRFPVPDAPGRIEPLPGVRLEIGPDGLLKPDGSPWLPGERVSILARMLRLVSLPQHLPATAGQDEDAGAAAHVHATLDGAGGAEVWAGPLHEGDRAFVGTGNRAVLAYLLLRQLLQDRERGRPAADAGWCSDDDLGVGIWGRGWVHNDVNALHVLIYRLRKGLAAVGVPPDALQKRRRATRLVVRRATVGSAEGSP